MFSGIRKRLTYANVTATLALVFAMTGGAYAAKHYLITSKAQISPKVLKRAAGVIRASPARTERRVRLDRRVPRERPASRAKPASAWLAPASSAQNPTKVGPP